MKSILKKKGTVFQTAMLVLSATFIYGAAQSDELWHYRNLGKAFYENPTTQFQAVDMFEKALELAPDSPVERLNFGLALVRAGRTAGGIAELKAVQASDPEIPHTWFNLGIIYKKEARYQEAVEQFDRMVQLVPDEAVSHYNLGVVLRLTGNSERALHHFERSAELDPNLAGPFFQIYNAYRALGRHEESQAALQQFQENKRRQTGAAVPEDLDWSYYSEIYDEIDPTLPVSAEPGEWFSRLHFEVNTLVEGLPGQSRLTVFGTPEGTALAVWSADGLHIVDLPSGSSREVFAGEVRFLAPGDFNNDGLTDFCIVRAEGAVVLANRGTSFETIELPVSGRFESAIWFDPDHDSDADLILLGADSRLIRNNGDSGFSDESLRFPFVSGTAVSAAMFELIKDTNGTDLLVAYRDRPAVLYRDRLAGNFEAIDQDALGPGDWELQAQDVDNDGWVDLVARGSEVRLLLNREGSLEAAVAAGSPAASVLSLDLLNRGTTDLVADCRTHVLVDVADYREAGCLQTLQDAVALAAHDVNSDGRIDLLALNPDGRLQLLTNQSRTDGNWIRISLEGVRNPKLAIGAEVEVKAASLYQKKFYEGRPMLFGLGEQELVDTVRITWPNGLIQNEPEQQPGQAVHYQEKQRLSGSCPMVFTWNGKEFEFITDVLAVAPLGAAAGDGIFFEVDHDEYVQISGDSLVPDTDGYYDIRITEELREITYLDHLKLIAVDRPEDLSVFTSDKFKSPPYPEFRLYGVRDRIYPQRALGTNGIDVLDRVISLDRTYPDHFQRDYVGGAEEHSLELNFGTAPTDRPAILVLHGWVDWADGSTIRKISQDETAQFIMPYLQVKDSDGEWVTVIEDMGVPAGKPKTIVVELTGKFLSPSREIRIVTNLCVYWDEIFLSEETAEPDVRLTELPYASAELRFRGFSTPVVHPERKQPESFDYNRWIPTSMWNPTDGLYTRYGPVEKLLEEVDDMFVIMGSGDELHLRFSADRLPPLPDGYARDFLLHVDGWAKDGDLNTGFSQTVEPLPFHEMSLYPYPDGEAYPDSPEHNTYRETYNIRPALRLIRPLKGDRTRPAAAYEGN